MSHALEFVNGQYSFAFVGDRTEIWHRLGQELPADATRDQWIAASGFGYHVEKVPALAALTGPMFDHIPAEKRFAETSQRFLVRQDNGTVLGFASDAYQVVQPADVFDWFERYITIDDRFHLDAAGVLHSGEKLWATARFNGGIDVAGERHVPRLLMSTSFDQSQPTRNEATMTRVVCRNTLRAAHMSAKAVVKTKHNARFRGDAVAKELAQIAQSFAEFKVMGDALAMVEMSRESVADFFKDVLEIPRDARRDQVSTRKLNQADDLYRALGVTKRERNSDRIDAWSALQAVTRYVDHDRSVRGSDGTADGLVAARFDAGTWGSGDALKGKAMELLMPMIGDFLATAPRDLVPV